MLQYLDYGNKFKIQYQGMKLLMLLGLAGICSGQNETNPTPALYFKSVTDILTQENLASEWKYYKQYYLKKYSNEEEDYRQSIYTQNRMKIEQHNIDYLMGKTTYKMGITKFVDQSDEEALEKSTGYVFTTGLKASLLSTKNVYVPSKNKIPENVDWRYNPFMPKVKNQLTCGSCYAFASLAQIESRLAIQNISVDLSEQHVVDCSSAQGNYGCEGGRMEAVYDFIIQNKGIALEDAYPYISKNGVCNSTNLKLIQPISSYYSVQKRSDHIQKAIANEGPVVAAFHVENNFFLYTNGIYSSTTCNKPPNHAIVLIGYGKRNNMPYYIGQNSWGTKWGIGGYFEIKAGNNMCGIESMVSFAVQ